MNSKQRAYLKGLAMSLEPLVHIGKNGVNDSLLKQLDEILEARELVKVKVLKNADFKASAAAQEVAKSTRAELVQTLGGMIVLYRKSKKDDIKHIVLP